MQKRDFLFVGCEAGHDLAEIIRTGKRRKGLTGAPLRRVSAAMVAAAMTRS